MESAIEPAIEKWLRELAAGRGREGALTGHQRHFLRVIDGRSMAVREEKLWLKVLRRLQMDQEELTTAQDERSARTFDEPVVSAAIAQPALPQDLGYEERLQARRIYKAAEARQVQLGESAACPATIGHPSLRPAPQALTERVHESLSEDEQILYVFWTALTWRWLMGSKSSFSSMFKEAMRTVGDALQAAGNMATDVGDSVTGAVRQVSESVADAATALRSGSEKLEASAVNRARATVGDSKAAVMERAGHGLVREAAGAVKTGAAAVSGIARAAADKGDVAGKAAEGLVKGVTGLAQGAVDAIGYTEEDIQFLRHEVESARRACLGNRAAYESAVTLKSGNGAETWLERYTIGGLLLTDLLSGRTVPPEVEAAYKAAFPIESADMDFADKAASMATDDQVIGLANAVKGKLFELKYVEELNNDLMPQGLHASLASSATQPGWDIEVTDHDGNVVDLLSLKATEHAAYIHHALERYPDIDVVSTSEVYAALAGTPDGVHLIDSGIENVDLSEQVGQAAEGHIDGLVVAGLSLLALLPAIYKHVVASDKSAPESARDLSAHIGRAKAAGLAGTAAMLVLPYWPASLLAAMGISQMARIGNNRREQAERLGHLRDAIQGESTRLLERRRAIC